MAGTDAVWLLTPAPLKAHADWRYGRHGVRGYAKLLTLSSLCRVRRPHTVTSFQRLYSAVSGTQGKMDAPGADTRCSLRCFAITLSFLHCFIRHPPAYQVLSVQMCRWTFDVHSSRHQLPAVFFITHPLQVLLKWARLHYKTLVQHV